MSQENYLVRSIYEAWGRGDFGSADWAHPDIEYTYADGINAGTRVGLRGMGESFRDWIGVFSDWTVEADEYIELDEDRVLVLFISTAHPKRSGPDTERLRSSGQAFSRCAADW